MNGRLRGSLLALGLAACAPAPPPASAPTAPPVPTRTWPRSAEEFLARPRGFYVVVDVERNEVRFMDSTTVLWSTPAGTGTGFRLETDRGRWEFSTPTGLFFVQSKELDPVWIVPDWYFLKNGRPVPPEDSPLRRQPGALGAAAIYLGHEIAIHGTDKPELLGQRVSHGCIRVADPFAVRLFHNVQIGTPVLIVGQAPPPDPNVPLPTNPGRPRRRPPNPWARLSTEALLQAVDRGLAADTGAAWVAPAAELIRRAIRDDSAALRGLLRRAGHGARPAVRREFATFLADLYTRGSWRTVVSLARIEPEARRRAAEAIVQAAMDLYPGDPQDPTAPWPTRRLLPDRLGPEGRRGWQALADAEAAWRAARRGTASAWGRERG